MARGDAGTCSGRKVRNEPALILAMRAPGPDPFLAWVTLLGLANRGAAPPTRLPRAAVDPGSFSAPLRARGDYAVALFVGIEQSLPKFHQGTQVCHFPHRPPRAETSQEQHFCSKYVSHPGQVALVEQGLADRAGRVRAEPAFRLRLVPVRAQHVGAKVADRALLVGGGQDLHDAEQVADGLPGVVGEDQPDAVAATGPFGGGLDPPGAVH